MTHVFSVRCQDKSPSKKKVPDEKNTKIDKEKEDLQESNKEKPTTSANGNASPPQVCEVIICSC